MKKLVLALITLVIAFSCADLEVTPRTGETANNIFKEGQDYRQYLAKIYAAYSLTGQDGPAGNGDISIINDEGFTSYIRAYWKAQELPTDEAVIQWNDAGIQDLNTQTWSSDNQFVRVLYYRIFYIVALANDFLEQSTEETMNNYGIPDEDRAEIAEYRTEARFLRALAYWHALDLFRNVPLITKISTENPAQAAPEEVFSFIETELQDIESEIAGPQQNEYGRADQAAVWMLQAKLYLNAEVYINEDRYSDVITAVNNVISAGYTLEPDYSHLFTADNHNSNELIFTLPSDGVNSQSWGSTTFLVHAAIGGDIMDPADWGVDAGWGGLRSTDVMFNKFDTVNDARGQFFFTEGQSPEIENLREFTDGFAFVKYSNLNSDGSEPSNLTHADTDYPMFRLGEAYLMYAEAHLRGGGGDLNTAVGYINDLRERAYGDQSGNIAPGDLDLDFILDERLRELSWEATRRVDLIRFGQFTEQGIWPWKGAEQEGVTTSSHLNIFPIPAFELNANPRMKQNPNY